MKRLSELAAALALSVILGAAVCAEKLAVEQRVSYPVDRIINRYAPITALIVPGDTIYSGCGAGLYCANLNGETWQKVMDVGDEEGGWRKDCYRREHFDRLFRPQPLASLLGSSGLLLYDCYCDLLLQLPSQIDSDPVADLWWRPWNRSYLQSVDLQGDLIVSQGFNDSDDFIDLRRLSDHNYFKRLYTIPRSIKATLQPLGVPGILTQPVLNPVDSTIWISIFAYQYIYVINLRGRLIDSVAVAGGDYIRPSLPASRLNTQAVWDDWRSHWTPTIALSYAPPDYVVLEYQIGWQHFSSDSVPLISTMVWNGNREPTELEIDHRWRIAGVQPDGRIIFGHYESDGDTCRVVLDIARIVP